MAAGRTSGRPTSAGDGDDRGADEREAGDWLETQLETDADAIAGKLDTDLENVFPDDHGAEDHGKAADVQADPQPAIEPWQATPSRQPVSSEDYNLEAFVAVEKTLAEHLEDQLGLAVADPALRLIGHALINEIDETGYLRADLDEFTERLGAPRAKIDEMLALIQTFDPVGVGGRDLAECLAIQLRERDRFDPAMAALCAHLDLVAKRDLAGLKRLCGVDDEDLADMLTELRSLNPKPGNAFGAVPVQPVIPDVMVRPRPDGSWLVELNTGTLPKVLVNQSYYATVAKQRKNDTDKAYLADCLQTANWLVKSLDQRARTILKVATEIVRQQDAFLAEGVQHLRPLNLKTVADAISMHESTVSRVTSNKYMATPRGIFELKYFFTASIASSGGGEAHSAEAVRFRIRKLIDEERTEAVLSDDTIVARLREAGRRYRPPHGREIPRVDAHSLLRAAAAGKGRRGLNAGQKSQIHQSLDRSG